MSLDRRICWNRLIDKSTSLHGWRLDGLLLNLLETGVGEPTLTSWPRGKRDRDWNAYMDDPETGSPLLKLLEEATQTTCDQCRNGFCGDCLHNAARSVLGLKHVVEHPPDCTECKRINEERKRKEDANREL